jgi:hypothetical protein
MIVPIGRLRAFLKRDEKRRANLAVTPNSHHDPFTSGDGGHSKCIQVLFEHR